MWVQTRQPVPGPGGSLVSVPSVTPPRRSTAAAAAGPASATPTAGEPSVVPPSGHRPSAFASEGTFLLLDDLPAPGTRDSFASILDDPFFLRYHDHDRDSEPDPGSEPEPQPAAAAAAPDLDPGATGAQTTGARHHDHERQQSWIPPRKESLSHTNPTPWVRNPVFPTLCRPDRAALAQGGRTREADTDRLQT